jgi:hypothetical protein
MDLNDLKAWDDSELISTWDEALEEYKVGLLRNHERVQSLTPHRNTIVYTSRVKGSRMS